MKGNLNTLLLLFACLTLYFLNVCFRHADHDEVWENITKDDWWADEVKRRHIWVDVVSKFGPNSAKVRIVYEMIDCQQGIPNVIEVY